MKKILTIALCFFVFFALIGCDNGANQEETPIYDLAGIIFEDTTVKYDGNAHSIKVENLPKGLTVEYEGNGKTEIGTYTVKAIIKYSTGETYTTLERTLTIVSSLKVDVSMVTFTDETFEYDSKEHSIYVKNLPEGVTVEYKYNGQILPGKHVVKATLKDSDGNVITYLAARIIITGTAGPVVGPGSGDGPTGPTIDVSAVEFEDKNVDYDGNMHKIELKNIPDGVIVTYLMNEQTDPGEYLVFAILTDEETLKEVARFTALLTINPGKEPTPEVDPIPETNYALYITPADGSAAYYVALYPGDEFEGYTQHVGTGVVLNAGDKVSCYDTINDACWGIQILNSHSTGEWIVEADGMICKQSGTYDVYVKMKFEADEIYYGPAN